MFSWLLWAPKLWLPRLAIQLQGSACAGQIMSRSSTGTARELPSKLCAYTVRAEIAATSPTPRRQQGQHLSLPWYNSAVAWLWPWFHHDRPDPCCLA